MLYSFQHIPFQLNGITMYANNLNLTVQNQLSPTYVASQAINNDFVATNGIVGSLSIDYYVTGADFITNYLARNESIVIAGNIAGLTFNSGYLSSYVMNVQTNNPIVARCQISFFEPLQGIVQIGTNSGITYDTSLAAHANSATITQLTGFSEQNVIFTNLDWEYSAELTPEYYARVTGTNYQVTPDRVTIGKRQIRTRFDSFSSDFDLSYTGKMVGVSLNVISPKTNSLQEFYLTSGVMLGRTVSVSTDRPLVSTFEVLSLSENAQSTNSLQSIFPVITSFTPSNGDNTTIVTVFGSNFGNVYGVSVGTSQIIRPYQITSPNQLSFLVPYDGTTGPIYLYNSFPNVVIASSTNFTFNYPPMIINNLSSYHGLAGDAIEIQGHNFRQISQVLLGTTPCSFRIIGNLGTTIYANIPNFDSNFTQDYINIKSDKLGLTAQSPYVWSAKSQVTGFNVATGIPFNTIQVLGTNLYGVYEVDFNNVAQTNISAVTPTAISVQVPVHATSGKIMVKYLDNNHLSDVATSPTNFRPIALIGNSFYNASQAVSQTFNEGDTFSGLAYNLDPAILNSTMAPNGTVYFNIDVGATTINVTRLGAPVGSEDYSQPFAFAGTFPNSDFGGEVFIEDKLGHFFPNPSGVSVFNAAPPTITSSNKPDLPIYGTINNLRIVGENLYNFISNDTQAFMFTGYWTYFMTNKIVPFHFYIPTGDIVTPLDVAGQTVNFDLSSLSLSGGALTLNTFLSNNQFVDDAAHDTSPWHAVRIASNGNVWPMPSNPAGLPACGYWPTLPSNTLYYEPLINHSFDNPDFFVAGCFAELVGRNAIYSTYGPGVAFNFKPISNKLLLANGVPDYPNCIAQNNVRFMRPPYLQDDSQTIIVGTTVTQSVTYTFVDIDDGNTNQRPKHVLMDDYIPGSPKKYSYWLRPQIGGNNNTALQIYTSFYHTPYYVLRGTNGKWRFIFNTPQKISVVALSCQDAYHTYINSKNLDFYQTDSDGFPIITTQTNQNGQTYQTLIQLADPQDVINNFSTSRATSKNINITLYNSAGTALASANGLVCQAPVGGSAVGAQGFQFTNVVFSYNGWNGGPRTLSADSSSTNPRIGANYLYGAWFPGPIQNVSVIELTNTQANPFVLAYIMAY